MSTEDRFVDQHVMTYDVDDSQKESDNHNFTTVMKLLLDEDQHMSNSCVHVYPRWEGRKSRNPSGVPHYYQTTPTFKETIWGWMRSVKDMPVHQATHRLKGRLTAHQISQLRRYYPEMLIPGAKLGPARATLEAIRARIINEYISQGFAVPVTY